VQPVVDHVSLVVLGRRGIGGWRDDIHRSRVPPQRFPWPAARNAVSMTVMMSLVVIALIGQRWKVRGMVAATLKR
jgi:hypothetical protein